MLKKVILIVMFCTLNVVLFAQQSKEELQRKTQELKKEIDELNQSLKNIQKSKKGALVAYNVIKSKVEARERLVQNINREMRVLDDNIYLSSLEINKLRKELDTLKTEYAGSLVFAYKNRSNYDYLNFIFSAATFNDAVKRITYLKSYRQYREQQVSNINKTQQMLEQKVAMLNSNKVQKNLSLQDQSKQLKDLEDDRKQQDREVSKLKGEESKYASQIKKQEKTRREMQNAITVIIRREVAEARKREQALAKQRADAEAARKKKEAAASALAKSNNAKQPSSIPPEELIVDAPAPRKESNRVYSPFESTEEGTSQSVNFETGKGRLSWPVDAGSVAIRFGPYSIPGTPLKGISDGVTILLPVGSSVKAIADGEVSQVFDLGGEQAVLVRHGKYFTTYSHLSTVNVSRGQAVKAGTLMGKAAANDDGEGEVLFMVSNEKGFLNPEGWLKRR